MARHAGPARGSAWRAITILATLHGTACTLTKCDWRGMCAIIINNNNKSEWASE